MNHRERPNAHRVLFLVAAAAAALTGGCADDSSTPTPATSSRQAEVAERGAAVMPFDLERTSHQFTKTDDGGVQTVAADDPRDTTQITFIRQHLTDPGRIHGDEMPGLETLRAHGGRITIAYETTPDGGRVTYTTSDTELRAALHTWFDTQVSDHGQHAR